MKTRTFVRLLVLLLVAVLGFSGLAISGTGVITAQAAAGDTDTTYSIAIAGAAWGHPTNLTFMNGMVHHANNFWNFLFVNAYDHRICYCIEPGTVIPDWGIEDSTYTEKDELWFKENLNSFNSTIDGDTVKEHLGRIMQYGYVGQVPWAWRDDPTGAYRAPIAQAIATQIMIWEVIVGERDAAFNHVTVPSGCNRVLDVISSSNPLRTEIMAAYTAIENGIKAHTNKPSFMADKMSDAQTVTLKWDGSKYSATLTDSNNVLGNYRFTASSGVTCSVSGNKLTLSSTTAPSGAVTITATKTLKRKGVVVWYKEAYQAMASYGQEVDDPLWGYVKVEAEQKGKAQIVKATTNGGSKAGWSFTVKNSAGATIGTYTTDASGVITLDLTPGTYTVTETGSTSPYWVNDPTATRTVTVTAGQTATVTFTNKYIGRAKIVKATTNGGSKAGWSFTVKNASGGTVGTYTTGASGEIVLDLEPGTYTVTETGSTSPYWVNDPTATRTVTVQAGQTATVTFTNRYIGRAKIIKALANPEAGSVSGWSFTVTGGSGTIGTYTTNAVGEIVLDLEPGTYTVTENIPEGSLWECPGGVTQTVTVKAGETAAVTFTNALKGASIQAIKTDPAGNPLSGAVFLLEWSEDGASWQPVTYTDSAVPQIGGCTAGELTDGKLTSGTDGLVVFPGLYPGLQYRLAEVAAPDGFQLLAAPAFEGTIDADNLSVSLKVVNAPEFVLPATGGEGFSFLPLAVVGLILSAWLLAINRQKKKPNQ